MDIQEYLDLIKSIKLGDEIALYYKGDEYWISHTREGKTLLTRSKDSYSQYFDSPDELFEHGKIEGQYLKDMYQDID